MHALAPSSRQVSNQQSVRNGGLPSSIARRKREFVPAPTIGALFLHAQVIPIRSPPSVLVGVQRPDTATVRLRSGYHWFVRVTHSEGQNTGVALFSESCGMSPSRPLAARPPRRRLEDAQRYWDGV